MTTTTDTKLRDQRDDTTDTGDTVSSTPPRHPELAAMHRLSNDDNAREEYYTTRALEKGEYTAEITDVAVSPRRHMFGEGFGAPDDDRKDPELISGYLTDTSSENVTDVLGTWNSYEKRQITHLTYSDDVYFELDLPSTGACYVSVVDLLDHFYTGDIEFPLLSELFSHTTHLSDFIGMEVIVTKITTSHVTVKAVTGGSNRLSRLSEDAGPFNTDTDLLTDVTGALHYLQQVMQDNPWIDGRYDFYIDDNHDTAAVAVDVCGVTRVFKFDINMNEWSKYRYFIDELGDGSPDAVSGTIPVSIASYVHVTRDAHNISMTDANVISVDTTGCWALGHPQNVSVTNNSAATNTEHTSSISSVRSWLRDLF